MYQTAQRSDIKDERGIWMMQLRQRRVGASGNLGFQRGQKQHEVMFSSLCEPPEMWRGHPGGTSSSLMSGGVNTDSCSYEVLVLEA